MEARRRGRRQRISVGHGTRFEKGRTMDDAIIATRFPRTRASSKSQKTQLRIIDTYLALMKNTDFDKITVSELVKEAGITRTTFYAYFEDVYDLLGYVENEIVEHMPRPSAEAAPALPAWELHSPTPEECNAPSWYVEWFDYVGFFCWQLDSLLGPHGNPQFSHKVRRMLREAHITQAHSEGFPNDLMQDWLINAMSDFQLRLAWDYLQDCLKNPDDAQRQDPVYFVNLIRVGSWYLHYLQGSTPSPEPRSEAEGGAAEEGDARAKLP